MKKEDLNITRSFVASMIKNINHDKINQEMEENHYILRSIHSEDFFCSDELKEFKEKAIVQLKQLKEKLKAESESEEIIKEKMSNYMLRKFDIIKEILESIVTLKVDESGSLYTLGFSLHYNYRYFRLEIKHKEIRMSLSFNEKNNKVEFSECIFSDETTKNLGVLFKMNQSVFVKYINDSINILECFKCAKLINYVYSEPNTMRYDKKTSMFKDKKIQIKIDSNQLYRDLDILNEEIELMEDISLKLIKKEKLDTYRVTLSQ